MTSETQGIYHAQDGPCFSEDSQRLIALARVIVPSIISEQTLAVAVGGSVARGCAEKGSDLDLLIFDSSIGTCSERISDIDGVHVAFLYCDPDYPFSLDGEGSSYLWLCRELSRVRSAITIFDRDNFFVGLQQRVTRMTLNPDIVSACYARAFDQINQAEAWVKEDRSLAAIALRAALIVAITPALHSPALPAHLYYSKPKYELDTITALTVPGVAALYLRLNALEGIDPSGVTLAADALSHLQRAVIGHEPPSKQTPAGIVYMRVTEFLADARNRLELDSPQAAAAPLQYGAFELAWLVANRRGDAYEWAPDASEALREAGVLDDFFTAVRVLPPPSADELQDGVNCLRDLVSILAAESE